jgi:hypothetical protein
MNLRICPLFAPLISQHIKKNRLLYGTAISQNTAACLVLHTGIDKGVRKQTQRQA